MSEHQELYLYSREEALRMNELQAWRESYRTNCDCARAMERAIQDHYADNVLNDCVEPLIKAYGFNRVNWVLANTVCQKEHDGRFSESNRQWARSFHVPKDEGDWQFTVESHPGLVNLAIGQARKAWAALGLFDRTHCLSEKEEKLDYTGKVVVIDPRIFKDAYKTPEDQLYLAESGFGCSPNARGRKVFGKFLKDGEETHYQRNDILGILKDEYLPDWAREKLAEQTSSVEAETGGMTLGGM